MTTAPKMAYLTLGWEVNAKQEPKYWTNWASKNPKVGSQKETDLVRVLAKDVGSHTAIIAQSGSGKSFFLGRLIEELVLETKARCVILDPNADFRRIREIDADLWDQAGYNPSENRFKLPHEPSKDAFLTKWEGISTKIKIRTGAAFGKETGYEQFKFWWPSLSVEFLADEGLGPIQRTELYYCHAFVTDIATLVKLKFLASRDPLDLIDIAEKLFFQGKDDHKSLKSVIEEAFEIEDLLSRVYANDLLLALDFFSVERPPPGAPKDYREGILRDIVEVAFNNALKAVEYPSREVGKYYFEKAIEYKTEGLLQSLVEAEESMRSSPGRIEVVDLPSFLSKNARLLAINTVLTTEWERARFEWSISLKEDENADKRVPTFIVVDEAHNLLPNETRTHAETALREQFRQIVAEGRKYGLFLVLVSQRSDKLDRVVVSECENKAIMRLGSASVLEITKKRLGLDDISQHELDKCLRLQKGRAMLFGRWSPEVRMLYCAARRTLEGGRNLNDAHWASSD